MFEKEAEETVDKSTWLFPQSKELAKDFWQKGAEFGYNKGKEELNQKGLALQSNMDKTNFSDVQIQLVREVYSNGFASGFTLNSDNKVIWHNLKKNPDDLPKDNNKLYLVYVYIWNGNYRKYGDYLPTVCEWNTEFNRFESMDDGVYNSRNIKNCIKWAEL